MKKIFKKKSKKIATTRRKKLFHFGKVARSDAATLIVIVGIILCSTILAMLAFWFGKNRNAEGGVTYSNVKTMSPLEKKIRTLVKGYPIETMAPYIAKQEPRVASLLVGIAKKESAWGKRKPVLDGQDCYNYWGFRQDSERMGSGGHTCFDSPLQAVEEVSKRLVQMVNEEKLDTPKKLVVWKCGYGCLDREKTASEQKWIRDVNYYYEKMMQ